MKMMAHLQAIGGRLGLHAAGHDLRLRYDPMYLHMMPSQDDSGITCAQSA